MKRFILFSLGLFSVLGSICRPSRESSPSRRSASQASSSAQAAASSSAVTANQGGYDARVDWGALTLLRNKPLKDLFYALKDALHSGNIERAKLLYRYMNLSERGDDEIDKFIKDVAPKNIPVFEQPANWWERRPSDDELVYRTIVEGGRKDLARLVVDTSIFAKEVAKSGQKIAADIADILAIDIHNLRHRVSDLSLTRGVVGRPHSDLAMNILWAEKALPKGDKGALQHYRDFIILRKDKTSNMLLRQKAEDVLDRIEQVLER